MQLPFKSAKRRVSASAASPMDDRENALVRDEVDLSTEALPSRARAQAGHLGRRAVEQMKPACMEAEKGDCEEEEEEGEGEGAVRQACPHDDMLICGCPSAGAHNIIEQDIAKGRLTAALAAQLGWQTVHKEYVYRPRLTLAAMVSRKRTLGAGRSAAGADTGAPPRLMQVTCCHQGVLVSHTTHQCLTSHPENWRRADVPRSPYEV